MRIPNWFLIVIAVCAVAITVATIYHTRYRFVPNVGVYDSWRSRVCTPDTCETFRPPTLPPVPDEAEFQAWKKAQGEPRFDTGVGPRPSLYDQYLRERKAVRDSAHGDDPFADLIPKHGKSNSK